MSGSNLVTGASGVFENVVLGDWIRKKTDSENLALQVIAISSTQLTLGGTYFGDTSSAVGVAVSESGYFSGALLQSKDDLKFYEGDSAFAGDSLVIENIASTAWFNASNAGVRQVTQIGVNNLTLTPFLRVQNNAGIAEGNRSMGIKVDGLYVLESPSYLYSSFRQVQRTSISQFNANERLLFLNPPTKVSKCSTSYGTKVKSEGKLGFDVSVVAGNDGYLFYTGLLRTAQRTIDGLDSDALSFPGRRAVGGKIEILPPLSKNIKISIKVTVKDGVNLSDITNDLKSTIISYISSLGVGDDVILSAIIARCMQISGVGAVTFTTPIPSEERISVDSDQKALIFSDNISIS